MIVRRVSHNHPGFWASIVHRISGVLLAFFLPLHFLTLGLALEGAAALEEFIVFSELTLVKFAEWGLVVLLTIHFGLGLRILVLEFLPWRGVRLSWIGWSAGGAFAVGLLFLAAAA